MIYGAPNRPTCHFMRSLRTYADAPSIEKKQRQVRTIDAAVEAFPEGLLQVPPCMERGAEQ